MITYLFFITLILLILIKYLNLNYDTFSNKNKLNILVHKSIQLSNIETILNLCKLKYGTKCNACIYNKNNNNKCNSKINVIHDDLKIKLNSDDSYIIVYNKSKINLSNDKFYNKYIKHKNNNSKFLIVNYDESLNVYNYIDTILNFMKKYNILM